MTAFQFAVTLAAWWFTIAWAFVRGHGAGLRARTRDRAAGAREELGWLIATAAVAVAVAASVRR